MKKTRREHIFVNEGISQVGSDRNTREHNLLWKKKKKRESTIIMENFTGTLGERERERERGLGFGAQVPVCSSVLGLLLFVLLVQLKMALKIDRWDLAPELLPSDDDPPPSDWINSSSSSYHEAKRASMPSHTFQLPIIAPFCCSCMRNISMTD